MRNGGHPTFARWRTALKRIAGGPLLGFICVALAPLVAAAWVGGGWSIVLYGAGVAAIGLNASAWLAAILFGQTRQLRASWFVLVAVLGSLVAAGAVWPKLGNDLFLVVATSFYILGFPTSMIFKIAMSEDMIPIVVIYVGVLASAYLQPFVLLPLLFRWRLERKDEPWPE